MRINFGYGLAPGQSVTPGQAVRRGHVIVTLPVLLIMATLWAGIYAVLKLLWPASLEDVSPLTLALFTVVPPGVAWLWWSFTVPRWRSWIQEVGADNDETQRLAQMTGLVWRKGHPFEATEFRHNSPTDEAPPNTRMDGTSANDG